MPTVEQNKNTWNRDFDWTQQGDEWSAAWGGVDMQWVASLLPRIHAFIPAATILEIAPGYGRWTQFLKNLCDRLIVVDSSEKCIKACEERFASSSHIEYHANDGKSLAMVPDHAIDFVFSFDSLVHAEEDVIQDYLTQFADKLTPDGIGFIHHSNIGEFKDYYSRVKKHSRLKTLFAKSDEVEDSAHWRAFSMTARKFEEFAAGAGLQCISQEVVNWGTSPERLIDCFSTFTPKGSTWARENRMLVNGSFMQEADNISKLAALYGAGSFQKFAPSAPRVEADRAGSGSARQ